MMDQLSLDIEWQILNLIFADNKCEFVSIIKGHLEKETPEISKSRLCSSELLVWICCYRAVDCATALVKGETGLTVDLNVPLKCGFLPLHHAALFLSSGLTELFLNHGARTDLRCDGFLPLHEALEMLSYHIDWTPQKSIFKLVIVLCLPQMVEPLKTIKLLAWETEGVKELMYHYAVEGEVIKFAALLMVAWEKIMDPIISESEAGCSLDDIKALRHWIATEIALLIEAKFKLVEKTKSNKFSRMCEDKKMAMMSMLVLLEVFERVGFPIQSYMRLNLSDSSAKELVVEKVACLLKNRGFVLNKKDTDLSEMDCYGSENSSNALILGQLGRVRDFTSQPKDLCFPLYSRTLSSFNAKVLELGKNGDFITVKNPLLLKLAKESNAILQNEEKPITGLPSKQRETIFSHPTHCPPHGKPNLFSVVRPFHTFQISRASFGSKFHTTVKTHVKKTTIAMGQYVSNSSSSKKWVSYALAIKRGMRHV